MNTESQPTVPTQSKEELTRKQKFFRRMVVPIALLGAGSVLATTASRGENQDDESTAGKASASASASATMLTTGTETFGGSDTGWGQGTAESAIEEAVEDGIDETAGKVTVGAVPDMANTEQEPILEIDEDMLMKQGQKALEIAGYSDILPDVGDELKVDVQVTRTVDNDEDTPGLSFEVVDAEIVDNKNNQE